MARFDADTIWLTEAYVNLMPGYDDGTALSDHNGVCIDLVDYPR